MWYFTAESKDFKILIFGNSLFIRWCILFELKCLSILSNAILNMLNFCYCLIVGLLSDHNAKRPSYIGKNIYDTFRTKYSRMDQVKFVEDSL